MVAGEAALSPEAGGVGALASLARLRDDLQRLRVQEQLRARAFEEGGKSRSASIHGGFAERLEGMEREVERLIRAEVRQHPLWVWAKNVKGLAEVSLATLVQHIDIRRANTVSALWRYCGFGVVDGKAERLVKGQRRSWNAAAKVAVWRVINLQVMQGGPYAEVYREAKARYQRDRSDWTAGHIEAAARRVAAKLFLAHLWEVWREAEGLPVRQPYIGAVEPHEVVGAWEFIERWSLAQVSGGGGGGASR
jgi:hypothetical protein